jgi:FkbM family methyltransferase
MRRFPVSAQPDTSDSVVCEGEYGVFEGSAADRVVMHEYRTLGTWAKGIVSLMVERLFADGPGTLIDVGANLGLVAIPVLERTGSIGIAFEPEPKNFAYLERNVARHGLGSRLELRQTACYSEPARLPMLLSDTNLGDHRLQRGVAADASADKHVIEVRAERLDDALRGRDLPRPIVLKVDAQGSEVCVFEGATETLARADYVITEYWPEGIVAHGENAARFEAAMRKFEFGAVLHVLPLPEPLNSSEHVFSQLSWIKQDGTDPGFFDLLFSRHWVLPNHGPELNELARLIAEDKRSRQ